MITVVTATFNSAKTLPALIESLRSQTNRDFEWIVMDGGSNDATVDMLAAAPDVVTRFVSEPDFGIYHALNKSLALASGAYYVVSGSDDVFEPNAMETFSRVARETNADFVAAPVHAGEGLMVPSRRVALIRSTPPLIAAHSVGTLIRRSLHDELGLYSRKFPIAADTLFLLKAIKAGKNFAYADEPVGRFGTAGVSSTDTLGALTEAFRCHVAVNGRFWLHAPLFVIRLIKNFPKLNRS